MRCRTRSLLFHTWRQPQCHTCRWLVCTHDATTDASNDGTTSRNANGKCTISKAYYVVSYYVYMLKMHNHFTGETSEALAQQLRYGTTASHMLEFFVESRVHVEQTYFSTIVQRRRKQFKCVEAISSRSLGSQAIVIQLVCFE